MADNSTPVTDLVVAAVKVEPLAESAKGVPYLRMNLVANNGEGEDDKVWFSGIAFGVLATVLSKKLAKGNKMKVTGSVSQKEYTSKKTGQPGVENKLTVISCKLSDGKQVVRYDEFSEIA
jgi:hypothetical protein